MNSTGTPQWQDDLLQRHQLDSRYLKAAQEWFAPLVQRLVEHQSSANRPLLIGLNGCQGSGKTTLADYLCTSLIAEHQLNAVSLSLDDFYLTRAERQSLAARVHPLLSTRGVPGTHDMGLLQLTLEQLLNPNRSQTVLIPRFNKASDDRRAVADWSRVTPPIHCVLLEGWCLGAAPVPPETLSKPLNALERNEDAAGLWRKYSNECLQQDFQALYPLIDQWIMLRAPSFNCVFNWRQEQERKLAATLPPEQSNKLMDDEALQRFIQHYERITRHCLADLPGKVHHLFELNEQRSVTHYNHRAIASV